MGKGLKAEVIPRRATAVCPRILEYYSKMYSYGENSSFELHCMSKKSCPLFKPIATLYCYFLFLGHTVTF